MTFVPKECDKNDNLSARRPRVKGLSWGDECVYIKLEQKRGDPGRQCTRFSGTLSSAEKNSRSASAQQMMHPQHPEESDESVNYLSAQSP